MLTKKLLFSALLLAAACQKDLKSDDEPKPEKTCRISQMIQGTHNGAVDDTIYTFYYNDAGRLERVNEHYTSTSDKYDFNLHYDNNNRLVNVGPGIETDFAYNEKGLLRGISYGFGDDSARIEFVYGSGELPAGAKYFEKFNGQWYDDGEAKYTFSNGNMVKKEWIENGVVTGSATYEYYDNIDNLKTHCLLSIHSIPLGFWEEFLSFNKNMLKKDADPDYGRSVNITLDSGRMVNSITTWLYLGDSALRETKNYFYDCR